MTTSIAPRKGVRANTAIRGKTVLLIEDDVDLSRSLQRRFEGAGYLVDTATDGMTGLCKSEELAPDLVILDLNLPRLNGQKVLDWIRLSDPICEVPLIVITGSSAPDLDFALERWDVASVLRKPFGYEELLEEAGRVLGDNEDASEKHW